MNSLFKRAPLKTLSSVSFTTFLCAEWEKSIFGQRWVSWSGLLTGHSCRLSLFPRLLRCEKSVCPRSAWKTPRWHELINTEMHAFLHLWRQNWWRLQHKAKQWLHLLWVSFSREPNNSSLNSLGKFRFCFCLSFLPNCKFLNISHPPTSTLAPRTRCFTAPRWALQRPLLDHSLDYQLPEITLGWQHQLQRFKWQRKQTFMLRPEEYIRVFYILQGERPQCKYGFLLVSPDSCTASKWNASIASEQPQPVTNRFRSASLYPPRSVHDFKYNIKDLKNEG